MLGQWNRPAARRLALRLFLSTTSAAHQAAKAINPTTQYDPQEAPKFSLAFKPHSLSLPPDSNMRIKDLEPKGLKGFGLRLMGYYHRESKLVRGAGVLHSRIARHVDNPALYATFGLEKTFRTTHAMLVLHMWLCLVRLRSEGKDGADFGQFLYEIYNQDLEKRVVAAGVKMLFSKWMKELEKMFYGSVIAYDNAMKPEASKDDLAKALWRNVFSEDGSLMPTGVLAIPVQDLTRYVRKEAACLALTDKDALLSGNLLFSEDGEEKSL